MAGYTRPGMIGGSRPGNFAEQMEKLGKLVGDGKITSEITFDQAYARRQHQGLLYNHPRGGGPFYLRDALVSLHRTHLQRVAMELFRGNAQVLYIRLAEDVSEKAASNAPTELGNLRRSGSTAVKVGGRVIYKRPAAMHRMTRSELNGRVRLHHLERLQGRFNR